MNKEKVVLFLKVFSILLILGFVIPYIIKLILSDIHFLNNKIPSGNSVFVMDRGPDNKALKEIICNILRKFITF